MKYAMWACCAVMVLPLAGYLVSGGTVSGLWQNVSVFAPLLLCVAVHLVLCKMIMGKSCHSAYDRKGANTAANAETSSAPAAPATVPAPSRGPGTWFATLAMERAQRRAAPAAGVRRALNSCAVPCGEGRTRLRPRC